MSRPQTRIVANITSDILCPWCWVAKRSIARASEKAGVVVETRWHPYFLYKDIPVGGTDKLKFYTRAFGKKNAKKLLTDPDTKVKLYGRELDIEMNWKEGTMLSHSMLGHRLLWHVLDVHGPEKQNDLMEVLFTIYLKENQNISNPAVLLSAIAQAGIPSEGVAEFLESDSLVQEVEDKHSFNQQNIKSIPHMEFTSESQSEPKILTGAQTVDSFTELFKTL
eukprot:TRINITY_DN10569_c0_g1_i1.p1 TRINITY_DN10569_c0_g1~~TRINITY_DN10569_c0_g1_i1.p1  ORF type:complete len:222 (+),score=36.49 TRINITY_DN10569_c0_g1_i1:119-784(+)